MEKKVIQFLPPEQLKILKVIQIHGHEWNKFTGYIPYVRNYNPNKYNHKAGDVMDEKIISILRNSFYKVDFCINKQIVFKGQLEAILKNIEGGARKNIEIQFTPYIPYHEILQLKEKTFNAYSYIFSLRLFLGQNDKRIRLINNFFNCELDQKKIEDLIKQIKPI